MRVYGYALVKDKYDRAYVYSLKNDAGVGFAATFKYVQSQVLSSGLFL